MIDVFRNQRIVERQLRAMWIAHFDLALMDAKTDTLTITNDHVLAQIKEIMEWLASENQRGMDVMVRPHGEHGMTLLDGLNLEQVHMMMNTGLEPAIVVQIDTGLYQA